MNELIIQIQKISIPEIVIAAIFLIVILGIILGLFKKTVIFYDYDDMAMCFAMFASPIAMWFILQFIWPLAGKSAFLIISLPSIIFFAGILYKTWKSQVRWIFPVVLITKLILGFLYVFAIWNMLSPRGKDGGSRRRNRALAAFFLMLTTPIIINLVANKTGIFFGPKNIKAKGVRGIGAIRSQME